MVTLRIFSMGECPFDFDYTVDCIDSSTGFDFERSFWLNAKHPWINICS